MKITINNKASNFDYKGWWGPLYKYEEIMDIANHPERKFNPAVTFHLHTMFYAILLTDNDTLDLTVEARMIWIIVTTLESRVFSLWMFLHRIITSQTIVI